MHVHSKISLPAFVRRHGQDKRLAPSQQVLGGEAHKVLCRR